MLIEVDDVRRTVARVMGQHDPNPDDRLLEDLGAQSIDQILLELYREGVITYECCLTHARDSKTLADRLHDDGVTP